MSDTIMHPRRLRLMTYNIQVGIRSRRRSDYYRLWWRHVLPPPTVTRHLLPIANALRDQDIVAIQEADIGSFRTRSVNLMHFLADRAGFPYWHAHCHRNIQPLARHGMGLLSRVQITDHECHKLPGRIAGRAAVVYRLGESDSTLSIIVTHLSLGRRDRHSQLSFLRDLAADSKHVILMGDLNCVPSELRSHPWLRDEHLQPPHDSMLTYPSWQPSAHIDHILATPGIKILSSGVKPFRWSDHLPVTMEIEVPDDVVITKTVSANSGH